MGVTMNRRALVYILTFIVLLGFPYVGLSQDIAVPWSSFNTGFAVSTSSTNKVWSSVGDMLVGTAEGNSTRIESGFLALVLRGGYNIVVGVEDFEDLTGLPGTYSLSQNYPNPFNPATTIEYALPKSDEVLLTIYNLRGQEVRRWGIPSQLAGYHALRWDARDAFGTPMSSGLYIYRLRAGDFTATKKMLLLK